MTLKGIELIYVGYNKSNLNSLMFLKAKEGTGQSHVPLKSLCTFLPSERPCSAYIVRGGEEGIHPLCAAFRNLLKY